MQMCGAGHDKSAFRPLAEAEKQFIKTYILISNFKSR